ncbi:DivIVA domain-containing protein [Frankia sp. Mgl5]|uniref:DivIVA domain-containing protein n=1 Tax=Frankia sp. Mgl5 TaxID=2933793 RepID=UPI00200D23FE|nr:DivIVA domain-containing protein [Frankia sp. Mgl5]MCK9926033.1 DivIVA domain-containing protein [Frankia sp. Mgl5]
MDPLGPPGHGTIDGVVLAVEIVLVAVVVFAVAALAVGRFDRMAPAVPDGPHTGLGARSVAADDVADVRFGMAARGYRMAEVDAVLARLAYEIAWRDEELARRDDELVRLAEFAHLGVGDDDAHPGPASGLDADADAVRPGDVQAESAGTEAARDPAAQHDSTRHDLEKLDPERPAPERADATRGDTHGPEASPSGENGRGEP